MQGRWFDATVQSENKLDLWKFVEHQLRETLVSVASRKMGSEDGSGDSLWKVGVWR